MRLGLQPPTAIREPPSLARVAAARVGVPSHPASGPHREPLLRAALNDTPLARTLARAVQQRASTVAPDPRGMIVARAPMSTATDRTAFIDFWTDVEMDIGSAAAYEDVYASFVRNAAAVEGDPMFAPVVGDMYEQVDDLIAAYLDGDTVEQMAENAGF